MIPACVIGIVVFLATLALTDDLHLAHDLALLAAPLAYLILLLSR